MSQPPIQPPGDLPQPTVFLEDEMRRSYLDYAMSVIVARALPDVRDGLKPVHRRILYAMHEHGYDWSKPYRKSARIVGDVMGQYHPHGGEAIYDAMVRMAQPFAMRLTLVDGQGNFGSMDGDPPAAMRYTEARLAKSAEPLLRDINRETVDYVPNYDEASTEPTVLPAEFPNLLVNGAGGIAVGMATNIPPHNLGEVIDACCAYIDNPGITIAELMEYVPGPDFPTGGVILGQRGIREAYHTGRGSIPVRARTSIERLGSDREAIIVSEIPYQVNKSRLIERIAEVVREKSVEGIGDLRDESDRDGVRVVIELKRDANSDVVLSQLYRHTPLQTSFGANMLALNGGRPELMSLKDIIACFIAFREEVITRRTKFLLRRARERAHILAGLLVALENIDQIIETIRRSADAEEARQALAGRGWPAESVAGFIALINDPGHAVVDGMYRLSEAQARAILELRLQRLTGLERDKLAEETRDLAERIRGYLELLASREKLLELMREEMMAIKERFADPRRTTLEEAEFEVDVEDLIQREDMVVTVSHLGYIKRVPLSTYRSQRRGGKGRSGMSTRDGDFVSRVFVANTHTPVLFFTSRGMVHQLKVYRLPLGQPQARGKAMVNILPLSEGETISTVMPMPPDEESWESLQVLFATASGQVRRNALSDFVNVKSNGKIAMKFEGDNADDRLVGVATCTEHQDVLLATRRGKCIRFPADRVRQFMSRSSVGVRGIALHDDDEVISLSILNHVDATTEERDAYLRLAGQRRRAQGVPEAAEGAEAGEEEMAAPEIRLPEERIAYFEAADEFILSVAEDGIGKLTSAFEYRVTGRGGSGIANMELGRAAGPSTVVAVFPASRADQIMLVTDAGQLIRVPVEGISITSRRTRGVTIFRVGEDERVVSVALLEEVANGDAEDDDDEAEEGGAPVIEGAADDQGPDGGDDAPGDGEPGGDGPEEDEER